MVILQLEHCVQACSEEPLTRFFLTVCSFFTFPLFMLFFFNLSYFSLYITENRIIKSVNSLNPRQVACFMSKDIYLLQAVCIYFYYVYSHKMEGSLLHIFLSILDEPISRYLVNIVCTLPYTSGCAWARVYTIDYTR